MSVVPKNRVQRRPVHGVLLLDKPLGFSSNQALQKVKWLLRAEKAGHTGTLDPLATGVLPLCFGAATKFSQPHLDAHKRYRAVVRLGQATTTGDAEGDVVQTAPAPDLSAVDLHALAQRLTGPQMQVPPMYSALKKDGKALYEYARAGETVERAPRAIEIFDLFLAPSLEYKHFTAIEIDVLCSKGTYIRTLGEDVARALGTVGHLVFLRRTLTGGFSEAECVSLAELEAMDEPSRMNALKPVDVLLSGHTAVALPTEDAGRFLSGLPRRVSHGDHEAVAVYGPPDTAGQAPLLGTGRIRTGELLPVRLLNPQEIQEAAAQSAATSF
jgi:tRNA pseudouridine55 synthase